MPKTNAMVELQLAAGWTDITTDVYLRDRITIKRGRQDEDSAVPPSSCTLTLNNRDGRYSPRNPMSPLYGQIGRNTPIRISTTGGPVRLRLDGAAASYAVTPLVTALRISGDLDVRAEAAGDWYGATSHTLAGRWATATADRSWLLRTGNGLVYFHWVDGAGSGWVTSAILPGPPLAQVQRHAAFRATLDVNNGAGGSTAVLYWAPTLAGPWTQLNSFTAASATSLQIGTADLVVTPDATTRGAPLVGDVYAVEVRSGIGGTVVASVNFAAQPVGTTSFTDGAGRAWTLHGAAEITDRNVRFTGEVSAWPPRWDRSGGDVYVPVQAAGILRRLGQGADPLQSTLRRRIPSDPTLVAYWPLEEGQNATSAYSPVAGVSPLSVSGLSFASDDSLGGSDALPTTSGGARMIGPVPVSNTGAWHIEFVYKIPTAPADGSAPQILSFTTTTGRWWVAADAGRITINVVDINGTLIEQSFIAPPTGMFGTWSRFKIQATQSGSNVNYDTSWLNIGGSGAGASDTFVGTVGAVTGINTTFEAGVAGMSVGHLAIFNGLDTNIYSSADKGFDGETVDARMIRLAAEEGVPLSLPYGLVGDTAMGPQSPDTLVSLLQGAADADMGILYEPRDTIALAARGRQSLYNQTPALTLDYATRGEVAPDLEPTEDDQATANDVTRSRPNGSSARAVLATGPLSVLPPSQGGVGRYPDSKSVNVSSDDQLADIASWALHLGTWDEARYSQVLVNLAAGPWLVEAAMAVDIGDRMQITSPPPWVAPGVIDLLAQGMTETIGVFDWTIAYNCAPAGPWTVAVADDAVLGRAGPGGLSTLSVAASATATTLTVAVASGPLWRTTSTNYPLDLRISGEVVTLTSVTGATSPQTFHVTRGTNGITKALPSGAVIELATPAIAAL